MGQIRLVLIRGEEQTDLGVVDTPFLPAKGASFALDEPGTTRKPTGEYRVSGVKHYHFWAAPEESEVVVFLEPAGGAPPSDWGRAAQVGGLNLYRTAKRF